ncbi:MAG: dTDP-4-dehydrorhamnose reductase [Lachnospiraceae bacterium]|nr:dTDP-4-dehydrorhamnose reductase [Lachnospiraceae bacterium]
MKVLATGFKGQLGYDVIKRLEALNIECKGVDIDDFDLTNKDQTINYILDYKPDVVVHCAAYTAVDKAEDNRELCYNINVNGTAYIAEACKKLDAKMVYISTDYVFEGLGTDEYKPDDKKNPINYYGETKSLGEDEVTKALEKFFIIRISWVFGVNGNNFVKTMLRLGAERDSLNVVADQIGSPTYTYDLAELIADMIQTDKYGIYHATNEGFCSWYEFTEEIMKCGNRNCKVSPIESKDYPTRAKRPFNSRMDKSKLEENGFKRMRSWQEAVQEYINILENNQ